MSAGWRELYYGLQEQLAGIADIQPGDQIQILQKMKPESAKKEPQTFYEQFIKAIAEPAMRMVGDSFSPEKQAQKDLLVYFKTEVDLVGILVKNIQEVPADRLKYEGDDIQDALGKTDRAIERIKRGFLHHEFVRGGDPTVAAEFGNVAKQLQEILLKVRALETQSETEITPKALPEGVKCDDSISLIIDGKPFEIKTNKDIPNRFPALYVRFEGVQDEAFVRTPLKAEMERGEVFLDRNHLSSFLGIENLESALEKFEKEYPEYHAKIEPVFDNQRAANLYVIRLLINLLKEDLQNKAGPLTAEETAQSIANLLPWITFNGLAVELSQKAQSVANTANAKAIEEQGDDAPQFFPQIPSSEDQIKALNKSEVGKNLLLEGAGPGETIVSIDSQAKGWRVVRNDGYVWKNSNTGDYEREVQFYRADLFIPFDGGEPRLTFS